MVRKARANKKVAPPPPKEILSFGKSYLDFLPEAVLENIFRMKHQLEFKRTVDLLNKLRVGLDYEIFDVHIPVKKLLSTVTKKVNLYKCISI